MDTKERILEKAHQLFNRYGIRSVSMDDIATQLGMSKKTLYQYYTDKNELVDEVFTGVMETNKNACLTCQQQKENAIHEDFLSFDAVKDMLLNMNPSVLFDMQKYHQQTFRKFLHFKDDFLYGIIKNNLTEGIKEGLYRTDMDIDVITRYKLYSVLLAFDNNVFPDNKTNLLHIEEQLFEHFLYGIATPKGQTLIEEYKNQRKKNK